MNAVNSMLLKLTSRTSVARLSATTRANILTTLTDNINDINNFIHETPSYFMRIQHDLDRDIVELLISGYGQMITYYIDEVLMDAKPR